jgi:hypothetical protein
MKHPMNGNVPIRDRSAPLSSSHLSASAKAAWRELAEIADGMGILTEGDPVALAGMAGGLGAQITVLGFGEEKDGNIGAVPRRLDDQCLTRPTRHVATRSSRRATR